VNFFYSADDTLLYVVNSSSSSIIVYSFVNGAVIGWFPASTTYAIAGLFGYAWI